eukprot:CAMPEP_0168558966 /NCGR_PEP_ID=MMETSP0413-20121227/10261_1 /TAXON_ID=136452 /ORGANISM="Filamoeba nolandi, Strain NC-AS-23-1" /LENGTH=489 /DNA_ID=CAMNT_0008590141 /DNA_START=40 /DNA_END=1509 /DNA_ORIENTATION=+
MAAKKGAKPTAVEWTWRGDQNNWIAFDADQTAFFEGEFQKGSKKIRVDKERFLDLSLSHDQVLKNFGKLDDDEHVIGMQRRYDDENKRRAIRRVVPEFFAKDTFLILGNLTKKQKEELQTDIELYGGVAGNKLTKKTTIILCPEEDAKDFEDDLKQATELKITILSPDYIAQCIKDKKKSNTNKFVVNYQPKPAAPPKRKQEGEDESQNKRQKEAAQNNNVANNNNNNNKQAAAPAPAPAAAPQPAKNDMPTTTITIPMAIEVFKECPSLKPGTHWMGTCTMDSDGSNFPLVMIVSERAKDTFSGEIQWPTLNAARTKFRGKINGNDITFEEYEVIKGEDDVEIPMKYSGQFQGASLTGKSEPSDPESSSVFVLNKVAAPVSKDLEPVKPKAKFSGVCYIPYKFEIEVTARKGNAVEGTISWPKVNATTKFKGTMEGDIVEFEEYESTSNDVEIPATYLGVLSNGKLGGNFKTDSNSDGLFEIDLSKTL